MRTSIAVTMITGFIAAAVAIPTPADATTFSQAQKLCAKNPNCTEPKNQTGTFCIKTAKGVCATQVWCPPKGACTTISRQGGGGQKLGNILGGSKVQTDPVKPAGPKIKTVKGPNGVTATTGQNPVVRDHRDSPLRGGGGKRH